MVKLIFNKVTDKWDLYLDNRLLITFSSFQRALDMALHILSFKERGFIE